MQVISKDMKGLDYRYFYLVEKMTNEEAKETEKNDIIDQSNLSNNINININYNPIIMLVDWEKLFYSRVEKVFL